MFTTVFLTLFTHSILKNEIHCAVIWRENLNNISEKSPDLTRNLTILKKIEDLELQNESVTQFNMKNETKGIMIRDDKSIDLDGTEFSKLPSFKEENEIPISSRKNHPESNVGGRQPKFFGSLAFLAGLGAGGLATAASDNVNTIVKLLNGPLPVPFGFPRYYAGSYAPPPYLPVSYPVWYPVPSLATNYQNFASPIPVLPSPIPVPVPAPVRQNTLNNNTAAGIGRQNSDTNLGNRTENIEPDDKEPHGNREAAATQTELKRSVALKDNDDIVEHESPVVSEEESELRQITNPPATKLKPSTTTEKITTSTTTEKITTSTTTMRTLEPTGTITTNSSMMNSTEESNGTEASTPLHGYFPFSGYYGGSPQVVNNVMFTTEDPQQRYLSEYSADAYALPFGRPAAFNPYQNGESYSSPFVNSFSAGEPYPEFLNTVESNRYLYDLENRQNYNGFRPILK